MNKTYKILSKNEETTADKVVVGNLILIHVDRWNGSYELKISAINQENNTVTLTDQDNHTHKVPLNYRVWLREYEERNEE